jgi:hypothetical protein
MANSMSAADAVSEIVPVVAVREGEVLVRVSVKYPLTAALGIVKTGAE